MSPSQCTTKKNDCTDNYQMGFISSEHSAQGHDTEQDENEKERNSGTNTDENIKSNINHQTPNKKRGLKPRSKRNRKKARGGGVLRQSSCESNDENDDYTKDVNIQIVPLFHNNPTRNERIRIIEPYFFRFSTFVKQRWVGRTVLDVYTEEFGSYPKSYYESAILSGRIMVNSKKVKPCHILKGGNEMTHTVHRHEPAIAVRDAPSSPHNNHTKSSSANPGNECDTKDINNLVPIIFEDDNIIVVDKPATVPIHPCGGYNFNSLFHILSERHKNQEPSVKEEKLYTIHRLDRLTSGLLICAKSSQVANELGKCIMDRSCQKLYLARVKGKFPKEARNNPNLTQLKNLAVGKERCPPNISCGEYIIDESNSQEHDVTTTCLPNKKKSKANNSDKKCALGYWITDNNNVILQKNGNDALEEVFLGCVKNQKLSNDDQIFKCQPSSLVDIIDCSSKSNNIIHENHKDLIFIKSSLTLHLACPCRISSPKIGICEAGAFPPSTSNVKPAQTSFTPLLYHKESDTTIVLCNPATGRTHQIRLHLQYLGHPIANDPNYGGELWYADEEGRVACKLAEERMNQMDINSGQIDDETDDQNDQDNQYKRSNGKPKGAITTDVPASEEEIRNAERAAIAIQLANESGSTNTKMLYEYIKKSCVWCRRSAGEERQNERSNLEFLVRSPGIWLHALQYSFVTQGSIERSYKTNYPKWALIENE